MGALIYALVYGVFLGLLSTNATILWLKLIGYGLSAWMFIAAIMVATRLTRSDD